MSMVVSSWSGEKMFFMVCIPEILVFLGNYVVCPPYGRNLETGQHQVTERCVVPPSGVFRDWSDAAINVGHKFAIP